MHFTGLIKNTPIMGVIDATKEFPLTAYDDKGDRFVVGTAHVSSFDKTGLYVTGQIVDKEFLTSIKNQPKDTIMYPNDSFVTFVRKPFLVTAVKITDENIDELAGLVGEVKEKEDGTKYIALDRRVIPNIRKAYVGWWITKLDDNIRCYSPKVFSNEFVDYDEGWEIYFDAINVANDESDAQLAAEVAAEASLADKTPTEVHAWDVPAPDVVGAFGRLTEDHGTLVVDL